MRVMRRCAVVAAVGVVLAVPAAASSRSYRTTFQMLQVTPAGVWTETSGLPFLFPSGTTFRYRIGVNRYIGQWLGASVSRGSTSEALAQVYRDAVGRFPSGSQGAIIDRPMTGVERPRFKVLADLYRDGDVLVVAAGHPACAGLSLVQARQIAKGEVTRWSQVVAGAPVDEIAVRYLQAPGEQFPIPRFGTRLVGSGVRWRVDYAPGGKGAFDGGVAQAASGDRAVAAITTWSRLRGARPGTCLVPLGGVSPSDSTVAGLAYPGAFPVSYVVARRLAGRRVADRQRNAVMRRAMQVKLLRDGRRVLRGRGLLVVGDPLPPS